MSPAHEPWHAMWTWGVVAAFVLYVAGTWLARGGAYSLRTAVAVAVVVQVMALAAPLLLSKDVYLYWSEARIAIVHHANPYTTTPSAYPGDPAHAYVSEIWLTEKAAYGPAWEALGTVPALAAGSSARRAELGYRVLAVFGVLITLLVVARRTRNPAAVALLGWSPLVALHFAGGGHNDAWMTALLVFAVAAPAAAAGGAAWSVAAAVKPVPAILLPLHLAARRFRAPRALVDRARRGGDRRRRRVDRGLRDALGRRRGCRRASVVTAGRRPLADSGRPPPSVRRRARPGSSSSPCTCSCSGRPGARGGRGCHWRRRPSASRRACCGRGTRSGRSRSRPSRSTTSLPSLRSGCPRTSCSPTRFRSRVRQMLSVVVPVYNERETVDELCRRLAAVLASLGRVRDHARRRRLDRRDVGRAARARRADERLRLLRLSRNFGHQIALTAGLDAARGDAVVLIDGDLQDPPEVIPELVACWQRGIRRRLRRPRAARGRVASQAVRDRRVLPPLPPHGRHGHPRRHGRLPAAVAARRRRPRAHAASARATCAV